MNIEEKVKEYAQNKMQQVLNDAVAEAYKEGYRQGYKDCEAKMPQEVTAGDVEYVDLGLPSETLWAKDYVRKDGGDALYLPYNKAKCYNIPDEEQVKELFIQCEIVSHSGAWGNPPKTEFIGPNGNTFVIWHESFNKNDDNERDGTAWFWIMNTNLSNPSRPNAAYIDDDGVRKITEQFSGFSLPIRLVK